MAGSHRSIYLMGGRTEMITFSLGVLVGAGIGFFVCALVCADKED